MSDRSAGDENVINGMVAALADKPPVPPIRSARLLYENGPGAPGLFSWALLDSNQRPKDYESSALPLS